MTTPTLGNITLPDDLLWVDEFAWSPIQQSSAFTLSGNLMVQQGMKQAGRPITLAGGQNFAWMDRATLLALQATLNPNNIQTLTLLDGRSFQVIWRGDNPLDGEPIVAYADPDNTDSYAVTLRFMTVG